MCTITRTVRLKHSHVEIFRGMLHAWLGRCNIRTCHVHLKPGMFRTYMTITLTDDNTDAVRNVARQIALLEYDLSKS